MPHFDAKFLGKHDAFGDMFVLDMVSPPGLDTASVGVLTDYDHEYSFMSRELAESFGVTDLPADVTIQLCHWNETDNSYHVFRPVDIHFRPAHPSRKARFVLISLVDLMDYFTCDPAIDDDGTPLLRLLPLPQYKDWCEKRSEAFFAQS